MKQHKSSIQIICPAFGRSGSTSLEVALEYLGVQPVYSYFHVIKQGPLFSEWCNIFLNDDPRPLLQEHIKEFQVVSDFPICVFAETLIENNPNAKVIVTIRDEKKWSESILRLYHLFSKLDVRFASLFSRRIRTVMKVFNQHVWPKLFEGGKPGDPDVAIQNNRKHIEKIKSMVPEDQLLIFNVEEGWKPLCDFLEIQEIPSIPFPHVNSGLFTIRSTAVQMALRWFR